RDSAAVTVELNNPVTLRVVHPIAEHGSTALPLSRPCEEFGQTVSMKDVVTEDEGDPIGANEFAANDKGIGEAARLVLSGVAQTKPPVRAIAQKPTEQRFVIFRGDNKYVANVGKHQRRQRIIDHRLVKYGEQLFGHNQGRRIESATGSPRENDSLHPIT